MARSDSGHAGATGTPMRLIRKVRTSQKGQSTKVREAATGNSLSLARWEVGDGVPGSPLIVA